MVFAGKSALQQFAQLGLSLTIGDFRQMCAELNKRFGESAGLDNHEVVDVFYNWMTDKIEEQAEPQENKIVKYPMTPPINEQAG